MIPRPNTAMRVRAPPENRLRKPRTPDDFDAAVSWATLEKLTKGTGTLAPNWYRAMMVSVKMTFLRRSGIRKMLARLESMGLLDAAVGRLYRLVRALPCAGGRPWPNGSGTTVMDPPAPVMVASADLEKACASTRMARDSAPPPRTLTRSPLWARPNSTRPARSMESPSTAASAPTLTGVYSMRKGFVKPLSLGIRCISG